MNLARLTFRAPARLGVSMLAVIPLLAGAPLVGCARKTNTQRPTVARETAEAEVRRISLTWTSTQVEKSLLSPPSPISSRSQSHISRIELGTDTGQEQLVVAEAFDLRAGGRVVCETRFEHPVRLRWGRKSGEAAVEMTRPAIVTPRRCDGTPPEATLSEPESRALFVLGSDQLVAVEPALDERIYRPASE